MNRIINFLRRPVFQGVTRRLDEKKRFLVNRKVSLASKRSSLLRILSIANQERLDAGLLIRNLSDEYTGSYRRRLLLVAKLIDSGASVIEALEQSPGVVSQQQLLTLQFAKQTGTLPEAFNSLLAESRDRSSQRVSRRSIFDSALYSGIVAILMIKVLAFLMIFIVPTFKKIAEELGMEVNDSLLSLIAVSNWLANYWPIVALLGVVLVLVCMSSTVRRWSSQLWLFRRFSPQPGASRADVIRLLAISSDSGRPLPAALSTLGRFHFDAPTRQKILVARNEIEQGETIWKSLSDACLISSNEAAGLSELKDGKSQAWAMRQLASTKSQQADRQTQTWLDLIRPATILILAPFVAWVGFSVMQFLSQMVEYFS